MNASRGASAPIARELSDWLGWIERLHPRTIDLGLERVAAALEAMQLSRPRFTVITIGGTNGKGSTVTLCEAILRAAGYRVGAYMSPHLVRYNERVRVDGRTVVDRELCEAFERVEAHRGDARLTYFEYGTLAALDIFTRQGIDVAILEVGMGGRLDAVNAVDPDIAVVTSIGIDHVDWLGPDRESIGREKAGIFRAARPAVCGDADPPASLIDAAAYAGAPLYRVGRDFSATATAQGWSYQFGGRLRPGLPLPLLRGEYQLRNAACALTALELLADRHPITQSQVREGLLTAFVPGRFQVLPGRTPIILDVAHNEQAAQALAKNLVQFRMPGRTHAVFGMLIDKPIADVARAVADQIDAWYAVSLDGARGARADQVADALLRAGARGAVTPFDSAVAGFEAARAAAEPGDRILGFGSFYTVGDILAHFEIGSA
ncbi:MAG TPA: bifunctional tetrahydrofolate synthase/dihydrofolate synthase [Burkholderiales bacterium]